jgi:hypothetical protein
MKATCRKVCVDNKYVSGCLEGKSLVTQHLLSPKPVVVLILSCEVISCKSCPMNNSVTHVATKVGYTLRIAITLELITNSFHIMCHQYVLAFKVRHFFVFQQRNALGFCVLPHFHHRNTFHVNAVRFYVLSPIQSVSKTVISVSDPLQR